MPIHLSIETEALIDKPWLNLQISTLSFLGFPPTQHHKIEKIRKNRIHVEGMKVCSCIIYERRYEAVKELWKICWKTCRLTGMIVSFFVLAFSRGSPQSSLIRILNILLVIVIILVWMHIAERIRQRNLPSNPILIHITEVLVLETVCTASRKYWGSANSDSKYKIDWQKFQTALLDISNRAAMNVRAVNEVVIEGM